MGGRYIETHTPSWIQIHIEPVFCSTAIDGDAIRPYCYVYDSFSSLIQERVVVLS